MRRAGVPFLPAMCAAAVLLLVIGCSGGNASGEPPAAEQSKAEGTEASSPEGQGLAFDARVGEPTSSEGITLTVQDVLIGTAVEGIMKPEEGRQIAAVFLNISNQSNRELSYSAVTDFILRDDRDGSYSAHMFSGKSPLLRSGFLSTGESDEGWLVFNPSAEAQQMVLIYRSEPSGDVRILLQE